ncbi:MAG TPA: hypothetical protein VN643_25085 [Pyrinomonadaceae bacterium]|nr:hypothetical protein [Pyrinomonadaceae bacterium]
MSENLEQQDAPFDWFELAVAILLGLAAVGAAWSSYQSSMWGGKSIEAYGEAATMSTRASTEHDHAEMDMAHDFECDMQAKERILEALDAQAENERKRLLHMASYLYAVEMSQIGYDYMKLPPEYHTAGDLKKHEGIPFEALKGALETKLGVEYEDKMLARGKSDYAAADKKFDDGRNASSTGDRFDLNTVVLTVSLFFAGLGLVFKTRIRWYFLVSGLIVFLYGTIYLAKTPWA